MKYYEEEAIQNMIIMLVE